MYNLIWLIFVYIYIYLAGFRDFCFNAGLPDTSILETTTEELDDSQIDNEDELSVKQDNVQEEKMEVCHY